MKKFYVGVKAILHDSEKGYLLLRDNSVPGGFWDNPGGRIDENESFEAALRRELTEEVLGIRDIEIGEFLGAYRVNRDVGENTGLILLYFHATANIPVDLKISEEHDNYLWVTSTGEIPQKGLNPEATRILSKKLKRY